MENSTRTSNGFRQIVITAHFSADAGRASALPEANTNTINLKRRNISVDLGHRFMPLHHKPHFQLVMNFESLNSKSSYREQKARPCHTAQSKRTTVKKRKLNEVNAGVN